MRQQPHESDIILDSTVEAIFRSLRMAFFRCSRPISLPPMNTPRVGRSLLRQGHGKASAGIWKQTLL